jgi:release factor glutamine methyltransferase
MEIYKSFLSKLVKIYNSKLSRKRRMNNNLSQLFEIQKALRKVNYPDYKRVSKEIAEFVEDEKDLKNVLDNIKKDKPWEYICGYTTFYTIPLEVNQNVMIPRTETEKLVGLAIQEFKDREFDTVVDIGTGSGCIIIALVKSLMLPSIYKDDIKDTQFIATDKSIKALKVARRNIKNHDLKDIIKTQKMDTIKKLKLEDKKVLLLANLPYIPLEQYEKLDRSVKDYEPKGALAGGRSGNKYYKRLIDEIEEKEMKSFTLILETEESIIDETKEIFGKYEPKVLKDINDKKRFLIMKN